MVTISIVFAALFTASLLVAEHYITLHFYGRKLPAIPRYILGMLAVLLPYSGLILVWQYHGNLAEPLWIMLAAIWAVTAAGGLAVAACYFVDSYNDHRNGHGDAVERENRLRDRLTGDE